MLQPALTLVCLPAGTPVETSTADAEAVAAETSLDSFGATTHFLTRRRRRLFTRTPQGVTTGGPLGELDLDAMRAAAQYRYWRRWGVWNWVVGNTRPAQPYWTFIARHEASPDKYTLDRARQDYLAQPRVLTMLTYNALPHRVADLPDSHLEAFQTDPDCYAYLGWLSGVPGDRLFCPDGTYLAADSEQHSLRLAYLHEANQRLDALDTGDVLVALHTR